MVLHGKNDRTCWFYRENRGVKHIGFRRKIEGSLLWSENRSDNYLGFRGNIEGPHILVLREKIELVIYLGFTRKKRSDKKIFSKLETPVVPTGEQ